MFIDSFYNALTPALELTVRETDLIDALCVRFTRDTTLEKQRKMEKLLTTRLQRYQTATNLCIYLEKHALELIRLGHARTLDTLAVTQLMTCLNTSESYHSSATPLQFRVSSGSSCGIDLGSYEETDSSK